VVVVVVHGNPAPHHQWTMVELADVLAHQVAVAQTLVTVLIVVSATTVVEVSMVKDILEDQVLDLMQILKILIKAVAVGVQAAPAQVLRMVDNDIARHLEAIKLQAAPDVQQIF
jgi:hypothetical protein